MNEHIIRRVAEDSCKTYTGICKESEDVYHVGELLAGFIIESPDERDSISFPLDTYSRNDVFLLNISLDYMRNQHPPGLIAVGPVFWILPVQVCEKVGYRKSCINTYPGVKH